MGIFHSISAFNNAGFALASDSLVSYGQDPLILGPIGLAIIIGGLGFLVVLELYRRASGQSSLVPRRRSTAMTHDEVVARGRSLSQRSRYRLGAFHPERFGFANPIPLSLHTRLMLIGTTIMIVVGTFGFALFEWANPLTLGPMSWWEKAIQSVFSGGITPQDRRLQHRGLRRGDPRDPPADRRADVRRRRQRQHRRRHQGDDPDDPVHGRTRGDPRAPGRQRAGPPDPQHDRPRRHLGRDDQPGRRAGRDDGPAGPHRPGASTSRCSRSPPRWPPSGCRPT